VGPPVTETWRGQLSPRESSKTSFLLRATTLELILATTTSLSAPCDNFLASHDNTGNDTDALELVTPCDNLGSTYSVRVLFLPFLPRGAVALCNNLVTPCDMRSNTDNVPFPMTGRGQRPNRTRASCLFTGEVQRGMSLPARNVLIILRRRRRTYEGGPRSSLWSKPTTPSLLT
jgi:hypothetical protein